MDAVDLGVNLFVALFALMDPIGNLPIFAAAIVGEAAVRRDKPPSMGSEDFGSFGGSGVPVVFWNLYASPFGDKSGAPNHSSEFVIDEKALRIGVRALTSATLAYMAQNPAAKR